jgi:hypothetical protein
VTNRPARIVDQQAVDDDRAVALAGIGLEAEQGCLVSVKGPFNFGHHLRVRIEVASVQAQAALDVVLLVSKWIAGRSKVDVLDAVFGKSRTESRLREASSTGQGESADIDHAVDSGLVE